MAPETGPQMFDFWIDKGARPEGAGGVLRNGILWETRPWLGAFWSIRDVHERINDAPLLNFAVERSGDKPGGPKIVGLLLKAGASPTRRTGEAKRLYSRSDYKDRPLSDWFLC